MSLKFYTMKYTMSSIVAHNREGGLTLCRMPSTRSNPNPERLRQARLQKGLTQENVAERAGLTFNSISRYETGAAHPSQLALNMLAVLYKKPVEWFLGGEAEELQVRLNTEGFKSTPEHEPSDVKVSLDERFQDFTARFDRLESYVRSVVAESEADAGDPSPAYGIARVRADYEPGNSDRSPVEVVEVASAAGVGAEVYDETPVGLLWFRNDWLQSHSIDPKQSHIISVRGDSMEQTLPDGCSILVDRSRREPQEGRIYVMRTDEGLVVKRLGLDEKGRWELLSDNPDWEPAIMPYGTDIVGEVRWSAVTH